MTVHKMLVNISTITNFSSYFPSSPPSPFITWSFHSVSENILNCCEIDDVLTSVWHWQQSQQGSINQTCRRRTGAFEPLRPRHSTQLAIGGNMKPTSRDHTAPRGLALFQGTELLHSWPPKPTVKAKIGWLHFFLFFPFYVATGNAASAAMSGPTATPGSTEPHSWSPECFS